MTLVVVALVLAAVGVTWSFIVAFGMVFTDFEPSFSLRPLLAPTATLVLAIVLFALAVSLRHRTEGTDGGRDD